MERYKMIKSIGDGSFGSVMQALDTETGELVAIKRMKQKYTSWEECVKLREVKSLRKLTHPNIVRLKEVIRESNELCFIFEYMEHNLYQVMKDRHQARMEGRRIIACDDCGCSSDHGYFCEDEIRWLIFQVLCGLAYMQKKGFYHRDMKPENLLITGLHVKIGDFGLAREIKSRPPYTDYVSTRWYRAPEVILRSPVYSYPIDVWALGCILAELFTNRPLFPGSGEIDQVRKICGVLGTPGKSSYRLGEGGGGEWLDGVQLAQRLGLILPHARPKHLSQIVPNASREAIELMRDLLQFDPANRPTPSAALQYPFFHPITRRGPQSLLGTLRPIPSPTHNSHLSSTNSSNSISTPASPPRGSIVLNSNFEIVKGQVDVRCAKRRSPKMEETGNYSYDSSASGSGKQDIATPKGGKENHQRAATNVQITTSGGTNKRQGSTKRRRSTLRNATLGGGSSPHDRPRVLTRNRKGLEKKHSPTLARRKAPNVKSEVKPPSMTGKVGNTQKIVEGEGRKVKVSRHGSLRAALGVKTGTSTHIQNATVKSQLGETSFMSQISETQPTLAGKNSRSKRISVPLIQPLKDQPPRRPSVVDALRSPIDGMEQERGRSSLSHRESTKKVATSIRARALSIGAPLTGADLSSTFSRRRKLSEDMASDHLFMPPTADEQESRGSPKEPANGGSTSLSSLKPATLQIQTQFRGTPQQIQSASLARNLSATPTSVMSGVHHQTPDGAQLRSASVMSTYTSQSNATIAEMETDQTLSGFSSTMELTTRKTSPTVEISSTSAFDTSIATLATDLPIPKKTKTMVSKMHSLRISRIPVRRSDGEKKAGRRPSIPLAAPQPASQTTQQPQLSTQPGVEIESKIPIAPRRQPVMQHANTPVQLMPSSQDPDSSIHSRSKSIAPTKLSRPPRMRSTTTTTMPIQQPAPPRWAHQNLQADVNRRQRLSQFVHRNKHDDKAETPTEPRKGAFGRHVAANRAAKPIQKDTTPHKDHYTSFRGHGTWAKPKGRQTPDVSTPQQSATERLRKRISLREDASLFTMTSSIMDTSMQSLSPMEAEFSPTTPQGASYTTKTPDEDTHDSQPKKLIGKLKHIRTMSLSLVQKRASGSHASPIHPGANTQHQLPQVAQGHVHQKASVWESWINTARKSRAPEYSEPPRAKSSMSQSGGRTKISTDKPVKTSGLGMFKRTTTSASSTASSRLPTPTSPVAEENPLKRDAGARSNPEMSFTAAIARPSSGLSGVGIPAAAVSSSKLSPRQNRKIPLPQPTTQAAQPVPSQSSNCKQASPTLGIRSHRLSGVPSRIKRDPVIPNSSNAMEQVGRPGNWASGMCDGRIAEDASAMTVNKSAMQLSMRN